MLTECSWWKVKEGAGVQTCAPSLCLWLNPPSLLGAAYSSYSACVPSISTTSITLANSIACQCRCPSLAGASAPVSSSSRQQHSHPQHSQHRPIELNRVPLIAFHPQELVGRLMAAAADSSGSGAQVAAADAAAVAARVRELLQQAKEAVLQAERQEVGACLGLCVLCV